MADRLPFRVSAEVSLTPTRDLLAWLRDLGVIREKTTPDRQELLRQLSEGIWSELRYRIDPHQGGAA